MPPRRFAAAASMAVRWGQQFTYLLPIGLVICHVLGLPGAVLAAQVVEIRYDNDIWPCQPKLGIQFLSPTEGWVGIVGRSPGRGGSHQPYLLTTSRGPEDLQPVKSLQLPAEHRLNDFFFLDRQFGWVAASELRVGGGPIRLWRTEDGGRTWRELAHNLPPGGIGGLQFVTSSIGWGLSDGVWRTEDGGTTWRLVLPKSAGTFAEFTKLVFVSPTVGWITGLGTIHHTTDGGETWILQYEGGEKGRLRARGMQFLSPSEGWVGWEAKHLLHTSDAGRTWRPVRIRHPRLGQLDRFNSAYFLTAQLGVVAGQHHEAEGVPKSILRGASPIAFGYHRPYLLVTFDAGRSWSYHKLPIPVGQWSGAGSLLFGINTVTGFPEQAGLVEVRLDLQRAKPGKR